MVTRTRHLKGRLRNGLEKENVDGSAVACPARGGQLVSQNYNLKNILTGTDNDTEHQNFWTLLLELYSAFSKLILTLHTCHGADRISAPFLHHLRWHTRFELISF